jgi:peptidoglycan/xylan/chitin deacetylase (PgdA/CDA1 family)
MKISLSLVLLTFSLSIFAKEISLSFDDAPRPDTAYLKGAERTKKLLASLKTSKVDKVIIYANGNKVLGENELQRLKDYKMAGHLVGNHTFSHPSAKKVTKEEFLSDFKKNHEFLEKNKILDKYFRYPYLHRGKTIEDVRSIRKEITESGYTDGYVTIDDYDWYMDSLFQQAVKDKKKINFSQLKKFYVETIMKSIEFYDELGTKNLSITPKHVLLLHENDLAALFISDLVKELRNKGWKIISPEESYQDPLLTVYPDVLDHGQGRVVSKIISQGFKGETRSGYEDERVLDQIFKDYKIAE